MDSADEEPELPSAVQHLIKLLEGRAEHLYYRPKPLQWLPILSNHDFQEFFPQRASLSTIVGLRREVRLRVLEAIGSCNTFTFLDVKRLFEGDISRLTASEWELLLRGFRRSTVLPAIRVEGLRWSSLAEVENLCLQLGEILKTSSVKDLRIVNCRLSATCFLNLASGLRGNDQSELESLELRDAWEDSSAVKHMADMIIGATRLETLEIEGSGGRMYDMDEEATRTLSQALIQSRSLKKLVLKEVKVKHMADIIINATRLETLEIGVSGGRMYDMDEGPTRTLSQALIQSWSLKKLVLKEVKDKASAFLLEALHGNRTIECLHLISVSGLGDCLPELLRSNTYLKEVTLTAIDMRHEEWRQLGEAIREDATARTIRVTHSIRHKDNFKGVEELACAASSNDKDPRVELIITFSDYRALMSALDFVGRVLRGNIKAVESLILFLNCPCPSGSNQNRMESIVPMDGNPGETSVLKRLRLYVDSKDNLKGVWKYLLCCLRENTSVTHLDLSDSGLDDEAFKELMGLLQVNLTLENIDVSRTAWAEDGKAALIQRALRENQNRAGYMSVFREANLTFGDAKAGRLFLCGSPRAGKTELQRTLMSIVQGRSLKGFLNEVWQKDEKIQVSVWDFARQEIFHTLQKMIFPQTSNFCIFQFVYNPICEIKSHKCSIKPHSCFERELEKWMRFINSNTRVIGHNLPQVLVVMSHKDKVKDYSLKVPYADTILRKVTKIFEEVVKLNHEWFHVDARNKHQVSPVKKHIFHILQELLREKSPRVPHLCYKLNSLLVTKTKKDKKCPIWSFQKFHDFCAPILERYISTYSAPYFDYSSIIKSVLSYLNDLGSIIYIPNLDYIIVDPNWLINTFVGKLIALGQQYQGQASKSSDETSSYTSKDGFMSESVFDQLIEDLLRKHPHAQRGVDREVLKNILINLEFCHKLEDTSQYCIPSFILEQEQEHEEGAHESMYGQNMDDTSQVVDIPIQCQDEDGEDDGKNEEEDGKDEEVEDESEDGKDGEREDEDGEGGEGEDEDREGEDEEGEGGEGENESEDGEGEDESEDGKDGEGEGGEGEDEKDEDEEEEGEDESIFFSCEEDGEDTSEYIIPSFVSKHASMEKHKHEEGGHESMYWYNSDENSQFVGIRIQCQDERTMSLDAAFFLRFQMFMRRKLISEMDVSKESVTCSRHHLRLFLDGHQIYVQQERNHRYVDVLMLCSKQTSRELARKYMMKHIVEEFISFCASPKGCPGVALVLGVIQTLCVEMLNLSHLRGAIMIEKLKSDFIRSINDKLEEMTLERSHLVNEEELFNYEHCWPPFERHQGRKSERARDLLLQSDVEAVVNCIRQMQLESFQEFFKKIQQGESLRKWRLPKMKPESDWSQASTCGETLRLEIEIVDMEMQRLEVMEMKKEQTLSLQRLEIMEMKMGQILSLQRQYPLQPKVQKLHSSEMEFLYMTLYGIIHYPPRLALLMPWLPYVTDDVGIFCTMSESMHYGRNVHLHFMCESESGFHMVKYQEGLKILLNRQNFGWIQKIIRISSTVLYHAAEAGLDVTFQLGQAQTIPSIDRLDALRLDAFSDVDIPDAIYSDDPFERIRMLDQGLIIPDDDRLDAISNSDDDDHRLLPSISDTWDRIYKTLEPHSFSTIFSLFKVEYVKRRAFARPWLCEECVGKGLRSGIFTVGN